MVNRRWVGTWWINLSFLCGLREAHCETMADMIMHQVSLLFILPSLTSLPFTLLPWVRTFQRKHPDSRFLLQVLFSRKLGRTHCFVFR